MFGDDTELQQLRKDWKTMPHDDKVDKFLWKMVWFHHQKYTPGNPNQAINTLTETIDKASESSEKLTKSIRIATWVAGIAATLGVVLGLFSLVNDFNSSSSGVAQKVFDECFDYYASLDPEKGIDDSLIQLCKDKKAVWSD
jgi:hypothetical protein